MFNVVQEKLVRPCANDCAIFRRNHMPSIADITYLVDNLPTNAEIVQMLAYFHAELRAAQLGANVEYYGKLPSSFLVLCYVRSMYLVEAPSDESDEVGGMARYTYFCQWHEHGDDEEEQAECGRKWAKTLETMEELPP